MINHLCLGPHSNLRPKSPGHQTQSEIFIYFIYSFIYLAMALTETEI